MSRVGWRSVTLAQVCEFKYGKSLPEANRSTGDVPVFGSNGKVGEHSEAITSGATIIIGRKGSFGEINYSDRSCWPIDTTYFVDSSATQANLRWLAYRLSALGLNRLNRAAAVPGLNREDAYRKQLLLPPISDQERIADILDKAGEIRSKRRLVLARLDSLVSAVFLDMFGDPNDNPRGWPEVALDSLGSLERGVSKHRPRDAAHLLGGPYPLIQTGEIANSGGYVRTYTSTYSEAGLRQSRLWKAGTLCITIAANIAKTGILTFDACFPDSVVGFRAGDSATVEYVRVWLSFLQQRLESSAPEVAQKNINLALLRSLSVPTPPIDLRKAFERRLLGIERLRAKQQQSAEVIDELFASLQHRAFHGELTA